MMNKRTLARLTILIAVLVLAFPFVSLATPGDTTRVSVSSGGSEGNSLSDKPDSSADGRYVAFESFASNLVSGDTNGFWDVFVHDNQTGVTTRVSVASDGTQGNDNSNGAPVISADGRYVAFDSQASNLVAGDTNNTFDVFVHDTQTGVTTRVSVDLNGVEGNSNSGGPAISADGRYVAFASSASNLVLNDFNSDQDIFVHDTQTGITTRVSVSTGGVEGNSTSYSPPAISADGRYVAFGSFASNLVAGDTNGDADAFLHDTQTGETTRISVDSSNMQGNNDSHSPVLSADGRYVAFYSAATNLIASDTNGAPDIFLRDTQTGTTTLISVDSNGIQGNGPSAGAAISPDANFVSFTSSATNLVSGDNNGANDVFLHDLQSGTTVLVSVSSGGDQGNGDSGNTTILGGGLYISFESSASNLVSGDTNSVTDVFLHEVAGLAPPGNNFLYLPGMLRMAQP